MSYIISVNSNQLMHILIKNAIKSHKILSPRGERILDDFNVFFNKYGPPLWSSGQSFWLQIQRSRVRFPALPDFLSSSGSGTGSTQPREVN